MGPYNLFTVAHLSRLPLLLFHPITVAWLCGRARTTCGPSKAKKAELVRCTVWSRPGVSWSVQAAARFSCDLHDEFWLDRQYKFFTTPSVFSQNYFVSFHAMLFCASSSLKNKTKYY